MTAPRFSDAFGDIFGNIFDQAPDPRAVLARQLLQLSHAMKDYGEKLEAYRAAVAARKAREAAQ